VAAFLQTINHDSRLGAFSRLGERRQEAQRAAVGAFARSFVAKFLSPVFISFFHEICIGNDPLLWLLRFFRFRSDKFGIAMITDRKSFASCGVCDLTNSCPTAIESLLAFVLPPLELNRMPSVLAIGFDPAVVDLKDAPGISPEMVRSFIESQLERVRSLGYNVESCLVDRGETAEATVADHLNRQDFDCIMFGAGLRAGPDLLLFVRLLNLAHEKAPRAKLCFNTTPADTAEAVQRWV